MALCPEHPERDQNPKFTPLNETTSIPVFFIWDSPPPPGGLQRTANEYAEERRIYKDLISKNNNEDILNSASRILQC